MAGKFVTLKLVGGLGGGGGVRLGSDDGSAGRAKAESRWNPLPSFSRDATRFANRDGGAVNAVSYTHLTLPTKA